MMQDSSIGPTAREQAFPFRTLPRLFQFASTWHSSVNALNYADGDGLISWSSSRFAELVRNLALGSWKAA